MSRHLGLILVLTVAMALATFWIGWWTVPVVGAAWGIARRGEDLPAATAAVAASLSWTLLLVLQAGRGPVGELSRRLGGIMGVPGWLPLLMTILFPAILGGAAAVLAGGVTPPAKREPSA
jgi:hypothetical protein